MSVYVCVTRGRGESLCVSLCMYVTLCVYVSLCVCVTLGGGVGGSLVSTKDE